MTLATLARLFNRALMHTFDLKKNMILFLFLFLSGLFFLFFQSFVSASPSWWKGAFFFFPYFLSMAIIASSGALLVRLYHHEVKGITSTLQKLFSESWDVMVTMTCFLLPLLVAYLVIWLLMGVFFLLTHIPIIGALFKVILSFGPFLLNVSSVFLVLAALLILFFITPIVALRGKVDGPGLTKLVTDRIKRDFFTNFLLLLIAFFPFWILFKVVFLGYYLTEPVLIPQSEPIQRVLQLVFMLIPFVAVLTPTVVFFFNFAAEAHVWSVAQGEGKPHEEGA